MDILFIVIGSVVGCVAVALREAYKSKEERKEKAIYVAPDYSKNKGKIEIVS